MNFKQIMHNVNITAAFTYFTNTHCRCI